MAFGEEEGKETSLTRERDWERICEELRAPVRWLGASRDGCRLVRLAACEHIPRLISAIARLRPRSHRLIARSMSRSPVVLITGASKCIAIRPASLELAG